MKDEINRLLYGFSKELKDKCESYGYPWKCCMNTNCDIINKTNIILSSLSPQPLTNELRFYLDDSPYVSPLCIEKSEIDKDIRDQTLQVQTLSMLTKYMDYIRKNKSYFDKELYRVDKYSPPMIKSELRTISDILNNCFEAAGAKTDYFINLFNFHEKSDTFKIWTVRDTDNTIHALATVRKTDDNIYTIENVCVKTKKIGCCKRLISSIVKEYGNEYDLELSVRVGPGIRFFRQ